jgi:hypothetical protein
MALAPALSQALPSVHTEDFIPDGIRTGFNGFENAPVSGWDFSGDFPHAEGGLSVAQVDGAGPAGIWMTCGAMHSAAYCFGATGHEGNFSWYPNGGDNGYTRLTRTDGLDFFNLGFLTGNAYTSVGATYLHYVLKDNGTTVLDGQVLVPQGSADRGYLGFGGGGFDEVWVSEVAVGGGRNLLAIDSIEMNAGNVSPVPEPAMVWMLGAGLACLAGRRWQSRAARSGR